MKIYRTPKQKEIRVLYSPFAGEVTSNLRSNSMNRDMQESFSDLYESGFRLISTEGSQRRGSNIYKGEQIKVYIFEK